MNEKRIPVTVPCFIMMCTNKTEKECLEKMLFGDRKSRLNHLKTIEKGHIGFLLNISKDQLLGVFVAESKAKLDIEPDAWNGEFPAQVKVRLVSKEVERLDAASDKLEKIIELRELSKGEKCYKVPFHNTYGPEITQKILNYFSKSIMLENQTGIIEPEDTLKCSLEDVAGLEEIKNFIRQRIIEPFEDEERAFNLKLKIGGGILLFGPPGTGKTLIAMAIANSIEGKFLEISPSIIIGYPGEAEKRIEKIFRDLENQPRAVLFLDEAEWILNRRESQGSTVMQRVTPVLLAQLSRIFRDKTKPIFVIAATNKPDMIDSAFLRPGRFDKIFYIGLPNKEARISILKLKLKGRGAPNLTEEDFSKFADSLKGYTGADIENIIEEAAYIAFKKKADYIKKEHIQESMNKVEKSVTEEEIESFKRWAESRGLRIRFDED